MITGPTRPLALHPSGTRRIFARRQPADARQPCLAVPFTQRLPMQWITSFARRFPIWRGCTLVAVVLAVAPLSGAQAQYPWVQSNCQDGNNDSDNLCLYPTIQALTGVKTGRDDGRYGYGHTAHSSVPGTAEAFGFSLNGPVGGSGSLTGLCPAAYSGNCGKAATRSYWGDFLYLDGTGISYVQLTLAVDGSITRYDGADPLVEFSVGPYVSDLIWYSPSDAVRAYANSTAGSGNTPSVQHYADRFTYTQPLIGGNAYSQFGFQTELRTYAVQSDPGSSVASWAFTGGVTGIHFFDANMQEVSDVPYIWDTGTQFYVPVSAVPEPSTWAMLGAGMLVLGAVRTRRSRRGSLTS